MTPASVWNWISWRVLSSLSVSLIQVSDARGGLGIGLSLVKGLIELHGGEVHASSEGPGHGSEITIRLPTQKFADSRDPAPKSTIADADALACYRILVIDDNSLAARTLQIFLQTKDTS